MVVLDVEAQAGDEMVAFDGNVYRLKLTAEQLLALTVEAMLEFASIRTEHFDTFGMYVDDETIARWYDHVRDK